MKTDIHPKYETLTVTCSCGSTFETRSTVDELRVELCSQCHPFYTGKQKLVDTGGRIDRFERRFGKRKRAGKADAEAAPEAEAAPAAEPDAAAPEAAPAEDAAAPEAPAEDASTDTDDAPAADAETETADAGDDATTEA